MGPPGSATTEKTPVDAGIQTHVDIEAPAVVVHVEPVAQTQVDVGKPTSL